MPNETLPNELCSNWPSQLYIATTTTQGYTCTTVGHTLFNGSWLPHTHTHFVCGRSDIFADSRQDVDQREATLMNNGRRSSPTQSSATDVGIGNAIIQLGLPRTTHVVSFSVKTDSTTHLQTVSLITETSFLTASYFTAASSGFYTQF